MMPPEPRAGNIPILWEPEVLTRIRHLALVARRTVRGVLFGTHLSSALGPNVEFVDFKEYTPGDSLRDLDWRVYARSDRLVIRRYQAESDLPSVVVLDASADMATGAAARVGSARPSLSGTKFGYALCLSATLATWLSLQGEPVGLLVLGGSDVPWRYLPPRGGKRHLAAILAVLASVRPSDQAELGATLSAIAPRLRRNSLFALVSDLMEETASWVPALRALGQRRTDLRVLHLHDPAELDLAFPTTRLFFSLEGGDALPLDPHAAREAFREVVRAWRAEVRKAIVSHRGLYLPVPTDRPLYEPLRSFIEATGREA